MKPGNLLQQGAKSGGITRSKDEGSFGALCNSQKRFFIR